MDKIRTIIVDDHAMLRDGIRALLSAETDIDVVGEASDGRQAIEKVEQLKPDVVIMDILMPDMDGLEACRRIKKKYPSTKILVLTQYDNREYVLSALKAGAIGYLPKKALGAELLSAIRAIYWGDSFLYPSAAAALVQNYHQNTEKEPYDLLTARGREILKLIADGYTSQKIAGMLSVSIKTVLGHRTKIMKTLDLHNKTELIRYAIRKGLITVD